MEDERPVFFAVTNNRSTRIPVGIRMADRLHHMAIVGATGTGKSTLIHTLAKADLLAGRGFALIDPHGDLATELADDVRLSGRSDVVYLDPADPTCGYGHNPLRCNDKDQIPFVASALMETFEKLWPSAWGVRMEHVLRNSLYALLDAGDATLHELLRLFHDAAYRAAIVSKVQNPVVRAFWQEEFDPLSVRQKAELVAPILNKLGAVLADPALYRALVAPAQHIDLRALMARGGVLIANLAKGRLGEDSSTTLGSILVSALGIAAFSRADTPSGKRQPFILYVDEFQIFTTLMFANMVSELRKQGVGMVVATQHLQQLRPEVRQAVVGNTGTWVVFRVGAEDAAFFAREFQPSVVPSNIMRLKDHDAYSCMYVGGEPTTPFSLTNQNANR